MNARFKILPIAALLAFGGLPRAGAAVVYTTGVQLSVFEGPYITAWMQPDLGGYGAGLFLRIDSNHDLLPVSYTLGIGHVWFSVLPGQILNPDYAATAVPFANAYTADVSGRIPLTLGQAFLLGFWLDNNTDKIPNQGDGFGWARLKETTAGLALIDSAIENTGVGIFAGTTTPAPELSSTLLSISTACLALLHRSRRSHDRYAQ